ncbi:hypothetical protein F5X96DRAFT_661336 [Biscogniauxia mediterranea]|nr:hypothetical protein F5X96DRAFT_661336 [Biscogniauxia mediterranea]
MFNSWTFKANGALSERQRTFDPGTGKTVCPQACGHCRAKKLKCTGERSGCQRCKAMSKTCVYVPSARGQRGVNNRKPGEQEQEPTTPEKKQPRKHVAPKRHSKNKLSKSSAHLESLVVSPVSTEKSYVTSNPSTPPALVPTTPKPYNDSPMTTAPSSPSSFSPASIPTGDFSPIDGGASLPFSLDSFFVRPDDYTTSNMMLLSGNSSSLDVSDPLDPLSFTESTSLPLLDMGSISDDFENFIHQEPCMGGQKPFYPQSTTEVSSEMVVDSSPISPSSTKSSNLSSCECFQHVILLMEEVEGLLGEESSTTFEEMPDMVLARHKEALRSMRTMLQCARCARSVENMTILTFLAAKLARLCLRVPSALKSDGISDSVIRDRFAKLENSDTFRSYKVDSLDEYQAVMRGLLEHQLRELDRLVKQLVDIARTLQSDAMARRLAAAKKTIATLLPISVLNFN